MPNDDLPEASGAPETSQLARVAVKPPPFWRTDPALWFLQLDAQFKLGQITADDTQFYTTVSALDTEVLHSVRDLVLNPPEKDKYLALKTKLIAVYADSETSKLKQLLQDLQLGDMRPSQLLSKMTELSSGNLSDNVLKSLWLSRLPNSTQAILAASSEPIARLAEMADKIHELANPYQIHEVQAQTPNISVLQQQIEELSKQVASLAAAQQYPPRNRSFSKNHHYRRRSNSRGRYRQPPPGICFYHHNFGKDALKCSPPCNYKPESGN